MRHWNNGTDHRHSKSCCDKSSPARRTMTEGQSVSLCNTLQWRHNGRVKRLKSPASRLFTQSFIQTQIKENIKAPHHWPLCGNSPGPGEFLAQMASYAENFSIWWPHHDKINEMLNYFILNVLVFRGMALSVQMEVYYTYTAAGSTIVSIGGTTRFYTRNPCHSPMLTYILKGLHWLVSIP